MATSDPTAHGTVSSTAKTLTSATFPAFSAAQVAAAKGIIVTVTVDNIRFLTNGGTPTATQGHLMIAPGSYIIMAGDGDTPQNISMIRQTNDATVSIQLLTNV